MKKYFIKYNKFLFKSINVKKDNHSKAQMLTEFQKENSQLSSSNKSFSVMLDDASQNYRELKGKFYFNASLIEFFSKLTL